MKKILATLGLVSLLGGCGIKPVFDPVEKFMPVKSKAALTDGYRVTITISDTNGDKKYDSITVNAKDETGNRLSSNLRFVDEDYDGNLDVVLGDYTDDKGVLNPDGVYEMKTTYDNFWDFAWGVKPTEEERKIDFFHQILLKDIE